MLRLERILVATLVPALSLTLPAAGQSARPGPGTVDSAVAVDREPGASEAAVWRFAVGERFEYAVVLGPARVGRASLAVERRGRIAGTAAHLVAMEVDAGLPFFGIDDRWSSWVATGPLRALEVEQQVEEGSDYRHERFRIDYERGRVETESWDENGVEIPRDRTDVDGRDLDGPALDDIGFLYLLRTMALEEGRTYRFDSHFLTDGNPVVFRVAGREEVRVPAGRFRTIVVEPVLPGMGILAPGTDARAYLSDDPERLLVKITTSTRFGTVSLHLKRYEPGSPEVTSAPTSDSAGPES